MATPKENPYQLGSGKTADVTVGSDTYCITVDDGPAITVARRDSREIRRYKASRHVQQT